MKARAMFILEFTFAILIIGLAIYITGKTFYSCDNNLFLNTTDAMPIYTKAKYAAQCLRDMKWPSWFPNWYCGTSVSQYYPPLTYIILTPLELFLQNPTLCLKIYIFSGLFIGGIGVWHIFYRYIGYIFGILAAVLYVALPYFAISFLFWGTVAQVPIIAIAPWYVFLCMEFYERPKATTWSAIIALTFIMLLSHVMHGFMIAICVFITMLSMSVVQKKSFVQILMWGIGTGLSAGLLGFWWVTGVLPLENPGVPSLAADAAKDVTANLLWFFPNLEHLITAFFPDMTNNIGSYFPYTIILLAALSYPFIRYEECKKKYVLLFLYIQTIFACIFSFGSYLPFYKYIPLANQLVPGRILTQAAIGATILTAYFISKLTFLFIGKPLNLNTLSVPLYKKCVAVLMLVPVIIFTHQSYFKYPTNVVTDYSIESNLYAQLDNETSNFNKGRLAWFGENFGSINTYFAYISQYNMVSGWNIEGTSTADYLRYQNTALAYEKKDYILKNIYDMNVQTCLVNKNNFPWLLKALEDKGFVNIGSSQSIEIMKRKDWNYFMEQIRNSIVIGKSSNVFLSDYPWFVKGYSSSPTDYEMDYLKHFNVIYYCEPQIKNLRQLNIFEKQITQLVEAGKSVFVEFGRTVFPAPILGVSPVSYTLEGDYIIESNDEFNGRKFYTGIDAGMIVQLIGTDESSYKLRRDTGNFTVDFIGTKNIGNGKVYFIGGPLSQLKNFAFNYLSGNRGNNPSMMKRDEILFNITEKIFKNLDIYKELELPAINTHDVKWGANSCQFTYQSNVDKWVMASITYTPRWKVYIDNVECKVERVDNMLAFSIPAGDHKVDMKYAVTKFGKLGIGVTIVSLIILIIILSLHKRVIDSLNFRVDTMIKYLGDSCSEK